ncbi:MAG: riboflavin synthase, partial [Dehalococcoidia bacterium]
EQTPDAFAVDLSQETLDRTNLGQLAEGSDVNLERALTPSSRMGGHIVQGHVDGTGVIAELGGPPESCVLRIEAPETLGRYIVEKGFIAVDGMSLTVAAISGTTFSVAVIPYTLEHTALRSRKSGDLVNLEADIVAKYVERLLPER